MVRVVGTLIVVGLIFAVAGVLFGIVGIRTARANRRFAAVAVRVPATVTEVRSRSVSHGGDSQLVFIPVVRFQTADGRTVDAEASGGTNRRRWQPGQPVEVLHDPENPASVRLDGSGTGFIQVMFMLFGVMFTLLGAVLIALAVAIGS